MKQDIRKIIAGLTPTQRAALRPFTTFSNADGGALIEKGLLTEKDGVWNHTPLGMKAYVEIVAQGKA